MLLVNVWAYYLTHDTLNDTLIFSFIELMTYLFINPENIGQKFVRVVDK